MIRAAFNGFALALVTFCAPWAIVFGAFAMADHTLPDPALTPGAVRITETVPMHTGCPTFYAMNAMTVPAGCPGPVTEAEVCGSRGTARFRHTMGVTKASVCRVYGVSPENCHGMEDDHDLSLELGGSDAKENHWPEEWSGPHGAHAKDRLENELRRLVCVRHTIKLEAAWRCIASNWILCAERAAAGHYSEMGK